jgi:hypothetical protein
MNVRSAAVIVLALEGVAGLSWVALLFVMPGLGSIFLPDDIPPDLIRTFTVADLAFFGVIPLSVALGLRRDWRWAWPLLCVHAGGVLYAALWAWGLVATRGEGWLGAVLMTPPAIVLPLLAYVMRPRNTSGG